jgi:hypothetical protein
MGVVELVDIVDRDNILRNMISHTYIALMREKTALIKIVNNMLKHKTMMPSADKITSILSKYDIVYSQIAR